jgi:hypothetical protein
MNKTATTPTQALFESLRRLYRDTGQLLLDCDRIISEKGWEPIPSGVWAESSALATASDKWFPRWVFRFYLPIKPDEESEDSIHTLKFVSAHFTSDGDTFVDDPLIISGNITYIEPLKRGGILRGNQGYSFYLCKSWFWKNKERTLGSWHSHKPEKYYKDTIDRIDTFALKLYDISSSNVLEDMVVNRLFD